MPLPEYNDLILTLEKRERRIAELEREFGRRQQAGPSAPIDPEVEQEAHSQRVINGISCVISGDDILEYVEEDNQLGNVIGRVRPDGTAEMFAAVAPVDADDAAVAIADAAIAVDAAVADDAAVDAADDAAVAVADAAIADADSFIGLRDMSMAFTDGQTIAHPLSRKRGQPVLETAWIGTYDKDSNAILRNGVSYRSLSAFAKAHNGRKTANGWADCFCNMHGAWVSTYRLGA
jgi:hypothetical protein